MITEFKYSDHDEWLKLRTNHIGGSEAGAVVGLNPHVSPYSLWAQKTGQSEPFEGNLTTKVGAYLEEFVAKLFEEETGKKVRRKNAMLVNDKFPWAEANVDRMVVGEDALLEIKTTNSLPVMRMTKRGEYPSQWYCQVMHYMAVTELKKAYLAVLINCREFQLFEIERDEEEIKALMAAEERFWKCVEDMTPPDIDGTEPTTKAISEVYPESDPGYTVDLQMFSEELENLKELKAQKEEIETSISEIENKIKDFMGEADEGLTDYVKITWKTQERKSFDHKRYSKEHPDIDLTDYYKVTKARPFTVKYNKGEN